MDEEDRWTCGVWVGLDNDIAPEDICSLELKSDVVNREDEVGGGKLRMGLV